MKSIKKVTLLFLLIPSIGYSQTLVKTYFDPLYKTKLKEVYQVKDNTPIANGYYKLYDEYGYLLIHRNYINNKQNGKSTTYYGANEASISYGGQNCLGQISGVYNYKNDKLEGVQLKYNYSKEGIRYLHFKRIFKDYIEIETFEYYSNNKLKEHNQLNGECIEYYENGKLFEKFTLVNGLYQGKYTYWYESGNILEQGEMINDKKEGVWIEYNEDGTIKSKKLYELGKYIPTEEEKELVRQKELIEKQKEEQKRKLIEEKRLAEVKELERIKKLEKEKLDFESKVDEKLRIYEKGITDIENEYKVKDEIQSSILGTPVYKFKKNHLYNAYTIVIAYINTQLRNNTDLEIKNKFLDLGISLNDKMSLLSKQKTKDLEKQLKKVEEPTQIIEILGLKK